MHLILSALGEKNNDYVITEPEQRCKSNPASFCNFALATQQGFKICRLSF